jgi:molybdenum cofactor biosynthesis enzyme MoaA
MEFKWLDFKITNRCNNHCTYCGVEHDSATEPEKVSLDTLTKTIADAKNLGFTHFAFLGGEPSLRNDFSLLMKPLQVEEEVDTVMVITNMLLFNETMCKAVFQTRARKAQIVASIDSLKEPNYKHQNTSLTLNHISLIQELAKSTVKMALERFKSIPSSLEKTSINSFLT